jgi:transposase
MEQLQVIEEEVAVALARIPLAKPILVMKGMSTLAVAGILGEAGDLSGYAHGHALLRHAGLNLAEASSGKWKGQMSISKRGRPRLRHALLMATMALIMNINPCLYFRNNSQYLAPGPEYWSYPAL